MKLSSFACCLCLILLCTEAFTQAQSPANVRITAAEKDCNHIKITLVSDTPFRFGDNQYILHIGQQTFTKNKQRNADDGSGNISFYIDEKDFSLLQEGSVIWLSYGNLLPDTATDEEIKKAAEEIPGMISYLGSFSKNIVSD